MSKLTQYDPENDLRRRYIHREARMQVRVSSGSPSEIAGYIELAWRRGQHTGIHDAYRILLKEHPVAAKSLLKATGMNPDGTL